MLLQIAVSLFVIPSLKMLTKCFIAVIMTMGTLFTVANFAVILKLFLSVVKSRFCTTCGNLYSFRRSTSMSFKLIRTTHRHCVFTIPEELRPFFLKTVNS